MRPAEIVKEIITEIRSLSNYVSTHFIIIITVDARGLREIEEGDFLMTADRNIARDK